MQVMTSPAASADWVIVSESILRTAHLPSLDSLLEEALEAWLEQAPPAMRWQVAVDLYTGEQVSSGRAAEIAGLNYFVFEQKLKDHGIAFLEAETLTAEETQPQKALIHAAFNLPRT